MSPYYKRDLILGAIIVVIFLIVRGIRWLLAPGS